MVSSQKQRLWKIKVMIVCVCNRISDKEICKRRCESVEEFMCECGKEFNCGKCIEYMEQILNEQKANRKDP